MFLVYSFLVFYSLQGVDAQKARETMI